MKLIALIRLKKTSDGGRETPVKMMFKGSASIGAAISSCTVQLMGQQILKPGEACDAEIQIPTNIGPLVVGSEVPLYEGVREVATATVKRIVR